MQKPRIFYYHEAQKHIPCHGCHGALVFSSPRHSQSQAVTEPLKIKKSKIKQKNTVVSYAFFGGGFCLPRSPSVLIARASFFQWDFNHKKQKESGRRRHDKAKPPESAKG